MTATETHCDPMVRRRQLILAWLLAFSCLNGHAAKPNILVIVADNLGWNDIGYNGSEIRTPHLDQLASAGVRLDRFYVYSMCSPTRAAFISGRAPSRYNILGDIEADPSESRSFAKERPGIVTRLQQSLRKQIAKDDISSQ